MSLTRRCLIAAAALAPSAAWAQPRRCPGRGAYVGPALHAPPAAAAFPGARPAGAVFTEAEKTGMVTAFARAAAARPTRALTAAVSRSPDEIWTRTWTADGAEPTRFYWASAGKAYTASAILQLVE